MTKSRKTRAEVKTEKKALEQQVPEWEVKLAGGLKVIILLSGVYQTLFGETAIGVMILIALAVISLPHVFTRSRISFIPIELEIIFFLMVVFQLVIGEARDFYSTVPYYDKFVHFTFPVYMGLIGLLIVYTMYFTGRLKATMAVMLTLVVMIALAIGALWEIVEYLSDEILYPRIEGWHHFQGSLTEDALHDTMNDLIADTLGAIVGALLGAWLISRAIKTDRARFPELLSEVDAELWGESGKK